jgi:hypothetical protein
MSGSRGDECVQYKSRLIMSLDRILGGGLFVTKAKREWESWFFDITIIIDLQKMHAKDLRTSNARVSGRKTGHRGASLAPGFVDAKSRV